MNCKRISSLLIGFGCSLFLISQEVSISGKVISQKNYPAPFATLEFTSTDDENVKFGAFCDEDGKFSLEIPKGEYKVFIEAIDHTPREITIKIVASKKDYQFVLQNDTTQLEEVEVKIERPLFRMELDKKVYDVSRDLAARGGNLQDVLRNVPTVNVDVDGSISVRGNGNIRVLIDGKPSGLMGIGSPAEAMRQISADAVERIEVITNPSSKYEAEGTAGIINIVMKKGKKNTANGSLEAFTGYFNNTGLNGNINLGKNKFRWFANTGIRQQNPEGRGQVKLENFDSNGNLDSYFENRTHRWRDQFSWNASTGFSFDIDSTQTINTNANFRQSNRKEDNRVNYDDFDGGLNLISRSIRNQRQDNQDFSYDLNLGYLKNFKKKGHQISFDSNFNESEETESSLIIERETFPTSTITDQDRTFNNQKQRAFLAKTDYVLPLKGKNKFETGARYDFRRFDTELLVERFDGTAWNPLPNFNDINRYDEQVTAGYIQYSGSLGKKFTYSTGLRVEHSNILVASFLNSTEIHKIYTDPFPSVYLNYNLNEKDQIQVSYSRRISRPRGRFLLPVTNFTDDRNIFFGNPDLNPSYTNAFEMGYNFQRGKFSFTPSLYFQNIQAPTEILITQQADLIISSPVNIDYQNRYGLELVYNYTGIPWWRMFGEINIFGFRQRGNVNNFDFNSEGIAWNFRYNSNFKLPWNLEGQLNANYTGPQDVGVNYRKGIFNMNISLARDFFKGNGTLTLSVQDVFNSNIRRILTDLDTFNRDIEFQFRQRQINLTFTYRFNKKKDKREQRPREEIPMDVF